MSKFRYAAALFFTVAASVCWGSDESIYFDTLKQRALSGMWNGAVDARGAQITPKDETERTTVPIASDHADWIIRNGRLVGVAQSCGIQWEPHYLRFMQSERRNADLSTKQAAYIGVLFGLAQYAFSLAHSKGGECTDVERGEVARAIERIGR